MKKLILFLSLILIFTSCIGYAAAPRTNYMASHSPSVNRDSQGIYGSIEINCSRRMDSISTTYKLQKLSGGTWYDVAGSTITYTERNVATITADVDYPLTAPFAVAYRLHSVATAKYGNFTDVNTAWNEIII